MLSRTDWTPNATMFDFRCSWISINHQQADANQFEFYRNGEWLDQRDVELRQQNRQRPGERLP